MLVEILLIPAALPTTFVLNASVLRPVPAGTSIRIGELKVLTAVPVIVCRNSLSCLLPPILYASSSLGGGTSMDLKFANHSLLVVAAATILVASSGNQVMLEILLSGSLGGMMCVI